MAEEDAIIKFGADIQPLLRDISRGDKAIQGLLSNIAKIGASGNNQQLDNYGKTLERRLDVIDTKMRELNRLMNGSGTAKQAKEAQREYERLEKVMDRVLIKAQQIDVRKATGVSGSTGAGNTFVSQLTSMPNFQRLSGVGVKLSNINEVLKDPSQSAATKNAMQRYQKRYESMAVALKTRVEQDINMLAQQLNVASTEQLRLMQDFGRLAGVGGGVSKAFSTQGIDALRKMASERIGSSSAGSRTQFATEITGLPVKNIAPAQRKALYEIYEQSKGTASAAPVAPAVKKEVDNAVKAVEVATSQLVVSTVKETANKAVSEIKKKKVTDPKTASAKGLYWTSINESNIGTLSPTQLMTAQRQYMRDNSLREAGLVNTEKEKLRKRKLDAAGPVEANYGTIGGTFKRTAMYGASAALLYGAVNQATQFFDTMVKMDKQLADLRKTLGGTDKDFDNLMTSATSIARTYKASTQDVLDAMELFSTQFKRPQDLGALSESAILFSNLSGQTLKTSAEVMISTIQQFNMAVSDSEKITDSWAAMAANSAVSIKDLGDAVGSAGGAAVTAGVDFNKFNAIISVIASSTGRSGKEAGNALKRIFERYTSEENIGKLGKQGINVKTASGEFRTFEDVIQELSTGIGGDSTKAWDKLTESQRKQIAVMMAGAKQYDAFLAIMNHYNRVVQLTAISENSLGEARRQNDRIAETFVKKLQAFGVEYDKLSRSIGSGLLPILGSLVDAVTGVARVFNESNPTLQKTIITMTAMTATVYALSKALKYFGTEKLASGLIQSSGGILGSMASPFISGDQKSFGVMNGISRLGGGLTSLGAGVGGAALVATGGKVGASAAAGGMAGLATGLGVVVAALAALATISYAVYKVFEKLRYKGDDLASGEMFWSEDGPSRNGEDFVKLKQQAESLAQLSAKIRGFSSSRGAAERGGASATEIGQIDSSGSGFLKDLAKENPEMLTKFDIYFDKFGNAMNITAEKLNKLANAIEEDSKAIENHTIAAAGGAAQLAAVELEKLLGTGNKIGLQNGQIFARIGEGTNNLAGVSTGASGLVKLRDSLIGAGVDLSNANANDSNVKSIFEGAGFGFAPESQRTNILDVLAKSRAIQSSSQNKFGPRMVELLIEDAKNAKAGKQTNLAGRFRDDINEAITANSQVPELLRVDLPKLDVVKSQRGVSSSEGRSRVRPQNVDITRIDFELQKSLATSANNFRIFGGSVNTVETSLNAVKQAMTDLANETEKASGPAEEMAKLNIEKEKAVIQQHISDINKDKTRTDKEQAIFAEQLKLQALDEKQAVQEINEERRKGLEILKEQYNRLINLQDAQESIRAGVKNLVGNDFLASARERGVSLGQTTEIGRGGRGTLQAEKEFLQLQYARQEMLNQREISAAASGGPGAVRNAEVNGRNALKHIREQMKGIDRQMDEINNKTNIWTNLLQKIGDTFLSRITDRLVDAGINMLGNAAGGGMGGFSLFGQSNPKENALNQNTAAIQALTAQILATNTSSHLTGTAAMVKGSTADVANRTAAQAAATAAGEAGKSGIEKTLTGPGMQKVLAGVMSAVAGAGMGFAITQGRGRTGGGGAIGGAIGGGLGSMIGAINPAAGAIAGPVLSVLGGFIGSIFDKPINAEVPELDELPEALDELTYEIATLEKALNTVNETMENLINAPGSFVLPIPKGVLENSITAQSAIATPLQAGGLIMRSGPAFLHAGEVVTSQNDLRRGGGNSVVNSITINGANKDPKQIAAEVMSEINRNMYKQNQRGTYPPRFN